MEDYLRGVRSRLRAGESEGHSIHVVLGGPEVDVDTVASTLSLALHLSQKESSNRLCVPVLFIPRCEAALPLETTTYLDRLNISESSLLWREDVDFLRLHRSGKLSVTLLRDGLLDSPECGVLASSIHRVVHRHGQRDAGHDETASSAAVAVVAGEVLQEATVHVGAALGEALREALQLQSEGLWIQHGRRSAHLDQLMTMLEERRDVAAVRRHDEAALRGTDSPAAVHQQLSRELKDFSDGEMTIALAATSLEVEDWYGYEDEFKSFCRHNNYESLMVVSVAAHPPHQQVVVYSSSTDMLNQICCELEESPCWSHSGLLEAVECSQGCLQVYNITTSTISSSDTPTPLEEGLQSLLKAFVDRRSSVLACQPSSRTSSTEGVAGSVEFSQGSSGITEMYGSDTERAEEAYGDVVAMAGETADGEEDSGGGGHGVGGELVSPDSGMATIRSSRSSKESSVFLSDDSPIGEVTAGAAAAAAGPGGIFLRNPSPLGFSSLSPPVPPERRKRHSSRNKSDNLDLFSFDPFHSSNHSLPTEGSLPHSGRTEDASRAGNDSLSEFEELSMVDFSAPNYLAELEGAPASDDHQTRSVAEHEMIDTMVPPTQVSSSSLSSCGVSFFQEDVAEGIKSLQHKESISSSLSEIWEEFGFDSRGDAAHVIEAGGSKGSENILEGGGVQGSRENEGEGEKQESGIPRLIPQLSLITEFIETDHNWNVDSELRQPLDSLTLADLQLTPPDEDVGIKGTSTIIEAQEEKPFMPRKKELLNTLTPDSSKEEDDGLQGRKGDRQMELLDFWTYSAQQGFMKSESETSASYPESLDMWNMTIRDDSISPLTTPEIDNLSEGSDSLCRRISSIGGEGLLESPLGYSNGGMEMWNTTIQEDSSSTVSPEATEIGRDDGSPQDVSTDALVTPTSQQVEEEKEEDQERWTNRVVQAASVKIVVQGLDRDDDPESNVQENTDEQNMTSDKLKNLTSSNQDLDGWAMPVPRMVTSTSEYDNVAESWSSPSSPDTHSSPVVDMIQLDGQSSPFVTLVKPMAADKVIESKSPRNIQHEAVSGSEESQSQVFQFEGGDELDRISGSGVRIRREYDNKEMEWSYSEPIWTDESNECSPFILVNGSTLSTTLPSVHLSSGDISVTQAHIPQSFSLNQVNLENLETTAENPIEDNKNPLIASSRNVEGGVMETMSLSSSSEGERDEQKYSLDSLHLCSRDDLRSNSDGDSSSCLEMESIIISGTVKEREQDGRDGFQLRQAEESGRCMETYSMLSYAATLLQTQPQESTKQIRRNKLVTDIDTPLSSETESRVLSFQTTSHGSSQCVPTDQPDSEGHKRNTMSSLQSPDKSTTDMFSATQSAMGSRHCQTSIDKTSQHYIVPEIIGPHMTKIDTDIYVQSDSPTTMGSKPQVEEGNSEAQSSIVVRSVSAPLRGPSDNFLKTREEVYVHSQISMEDSDEGGQSPSDPSFCHRFLGGFQGWRDQPVEYHTAPTASAPQSPEFTNSSVSHNSSFIGTPVSESGNAAERVVGLPFSGDLMEDLDDEEEEVDVGEEEAGECFDVTLQPISDPSQIEAAYSSEQSIRSHGIEELSANQATGGSPGDSSVLSWSPTTVNGNSSPSSLTRRHQEMTSQPTYESSPCPWGEDPRSAYYQTQFGYNYHRTDQRIESQSHRQDNLDTRPESPADLTPEIRRADDDEEPEQYESTLSYRNEYTESYGTEENPGYTTQHQREKKDAEEMCGSDQAEGWGQRYEPDHTCRQFDGQTAYQARSEDHAQYVPEGYTHFLLTRAALPGDHAAEAKMMMRTAASMEEGVDEGENREDPPSLDLSGGSNHRKRLAAPPMDVSLDRSEGSLLSDDGLETGDEALDTGDDLDINIDELDTPDETDSLEIDRLGGCEASNQEAGAGASGAIPESRMAEERRDSRLWRSVVIGEQEHRIDMKCIEPYMRVVSHGGYYGDQNAIIVFAACFLPDSNCENYNYVMENLFLYVISTLELMVAEDYMIIYLNGATPRRRMPGFSWMKKCYQMIDRRLKKNLKLFIIVHPSWFIRTVLGLTRPFISSKFSSKIKYVHSLAELRGMIPMEYVHIPPSIVKYEEEMGIHKFACMRLDEELQETAAKDKKWGNSVV